MNDSIKEFFRLRLQVRGLIATSLAVPGVILCLATLFGFLGKYGWFFDLFSNFRVQYLLSLILLAPLYWALRHRVSASICLLLALLNLGVVLPRYFGLQVILPEAMHPFRAMLLNVNTHSGDPERVALLIQDIDPDILVLEEISDRWMSDLSSLTRSHPYSRMELREDNFGIGLFSKFPLLDATIMYIGDFPVPSILATVDTGAGRFRVLATHPLPPWGTMYSQYRNEQLDRLPEYVSSTLPFLLLGDLNTTPWSYHFRKLVRRSGLIDSSKGRGIQPSWPTSNPLLLIPLDHCLHSADLFIANRIIGPDAGSDHYPLIVDFSIPANGG